MSDLTPTDQTANSPALNLTVLDLNNPDLPQFDISVPENAETLLESLKLMIANSTSDQVQCLRDINQVLDRVDAQNKEGIRYLDECSKYLLMQIGRKELEVSKIDPQTVKAYLSGAISFHGLSRD